MIARAKLLTLWLGIALAVLILVVARSVTDWTAVLTK